MRYSHTSTLDRLIWSNFWICYLSSTLINPFSVGSGHPISFERENGLWHTGYICGMHRCHLLVNFPKNEQTSTSGYVNKLYHIEIFFFFGKMKRYDKINYFYFFISFDYKTEISLCERRRREARKIRYNISNLIYQWLTYHHLNIRMHTEIDTHSKKRSRICFRM